MEKENIKHRPFGIKKIHTLYTRNTDRKTQAIDLLSRNTCVESIFDQWNILLKNVAKWS